VPKAKHSCALRHDSFVGLASWNPEYEKEQKISGNYCCFINI